MIYCPVCQPQDANPHWIALMCVACREKREAAQRPPQTEQEERAACAYELGWLAAQVWDATGTHPNAITERMEREGALDLRSLDARQIADLCRAIRDEFPALGLGGP
jgi:hypothetical protein